MNDHKFYLVSIIDEPFPSPSSSVAKIDELISMADVEKFIRDYQPREYFVVFGQMVATSLNKQP